MITEKYPFKGVENYFTDSLLYQDYLERNENPQPEEPDSDNEVELNQRKKKNVFGS